MSKENFKKKVLIVAPFWQKPGYIGNYRVERFIRWLKSNNHSIQVLKAGRKNDIIEKEWGIEITKRDYIFIITEILRGLSNKKILNLFWYMWLIVILILSPVDEFFLWATRILSGVKFKRYFKDIDLIISTSPPNSSHIAAYKISAQYSIPLIIDLRDGWLDEPLEQKLKKIKSLRKKETSLESVIIGHASKIFVTSKIWKEMLGNRFKQINNNIKILTNAYPEFKFSNNIENREKITLLYTGRFTGSSKKRRLDLLLNPLYYALKENNTEIEITFLSDLRREEFKSFEDWKKKFDSHNISLNLYKYLPRIKMFEFIEQSSGLLLLSAGYGPLPSKLFEYIKSSKPIFAVTPKGSAVWQLSEKLPQLFLYDYTNVIKDYTPIERFLIACKMKNYDYKIPNEFTEEFLSKIFLSELESLFTRVKI